ncbi:YlxR family protein [Synechococcus sp. CBW1004]|uniref:YlxR family protein n=1 Tax=Synechococcus sp. CBW1004 TaxID=1353136 RepID=UPI0018CE4674|nr:YlxR family protein [Synechococcus sp. CBW1004]QPN64539.1 YlxR family protein [Synechococcus sp. CBW1004]
MSRTVAARPVLRRCVACRVLRDRSELWRVIRLAQGGLALDRGMGRSAYLCPSRDCLEEARRRKRLQKGLRCPVPEAVLDGLAARLAEAGGASVEAR